MATATRIDTASALAALLGGALEGVSPDTPLSGLADDSRLVEAGHVFFARRGADSDGARFAESAMQAGAALVVGGQELPQGVPCLRTSDVEGALRMAADVWYGRPQDALDLIGITGTKGKTTVSWLIRAAVEAAGRKSALLGTITHDLRDGTPLKARNTTPGVLELRQLLARARDAGCDTAVMEVSSHALDQRRVAGLSFRVGVFTNLRSDHLDYHHTPEAYYHAKARLFEGLASSATAVLNREDPTWTRLASACRGSTLTYGATPEADLRMRDLSLEVGRTRFALVVGGESEIEVETQLVGRHNALNLLAAVGAAAGLGLDPLVAAEGAAQVVRIPGRLQRVGEGSDLNVFVDYAHTEDALVQVLGFLKAVGASPLVCVIGCGGDRDTTKRPRMARVSAEYADRSIFTSDNPRSEDPQAILDQMLAGVPEDAGQREQSAVLGDVTSVIDRREAIQRAVLEAPPGATVLVAGKGHETWQIVGTQARPFDDAQEVKEALAERARRAEAGENPWGSPGA